MEMIAEDLMRKYKYGYVHSCELLEEPFIKDLLKENQQLKKQDEETDRKLFLTKKELDMREKSIDNKLNQQKEFIKYLEDEISKLKKEFDNYVYDDYSEEKGKYDTCIEILQKYKEIMGDDKD